MTQKKELEGEWRLIQHYTVGPDGVGEWKPKIPDSAQLIIAGNFYRFVCHGRVFVDAFFRLNIATEPKQIDVLCTLDDPSGATGIYRLTDDELITHLANPRPSSFEPSTTIGSGLAVYSRIPVGS